MANFSDFDDAALGAMVRRRVVDHNELNASGHLDTTAGAHWNKWGKDIKAARDAANAEAEQAEEGDSASPEIEQRDHGNDKRRGHDSARRSTVSIDSALAERLDHGRARRAAGLDYGVQYESDGITVKSRPSGT